MKCHSMKNLKKRGFNGAGSIPAWAMEGNFGSKCFLSLGGLPKEGEG